METRKDQEGLTPIEAQKLRKCLKTFEKYRKVSSVANNCKVSRDTYDRLMVRGKDLEPRTRNSIWNNLADITDDMQSAVMEAGRKS